MKMKWETERQGKVEHGFDLSNPGSVKDEVLDNRDEDWISPDLEWDMGEFGRSCYFLVIHVLILILNNN